MRTKKGYIAQITEIDKYIWFNNKINKESGIPVYELSKVEFENLVTKHSKNIIDLIEVGDYVNGVEVKDIDDEWVTMSDTKIPILKSIANGLIKSIVTKEQFDSIKYEV